MHPREKAAIAATLSDAGLLDRVRAVAGGAVGKCGGHATVITLHNLTVSYRHHPALHHISGQFATGSLTASSAKTLRSSSIFAPLSAAISLP